jgi:hypothetical protein
MSGFHLRAGIPETSPGPEILFSIEKIAYFPARCKRGKWGRNPEPLRKRLTFLKEQRNMIKKEQRNMIK